MTTASPFHAGERRIQRLLGVAEIEDWARKVVHSHNTIGNLVLDGRAGLLFVDFTTGNLLQLTGHTTIDWDSSAVARVPGARRLVVFDVVEVVELPAALPLRWDASPESVRSLRLVDKVPHIHTESFGPVG